ncbi:hypothetical protein AMAG_16342 [Allomyces macrogynus ATCC 38327]|uniref:Uncharacterized protein n=1 Tax=Allomyces macrogynus (strain ATCC 38327) TaxID=578462 RepID=A0A0L0TAT4_ALLM3|nr:hypothetical protein AMAG_16342 [Allomyces macrogynus ATCC 38327]|eukprot:KNE71918.1 hypothetical protein AMAG_16342 [Allomyces macrogynus ATCC 38327]
MLSLLRFAKDMTRRYGRAFVGMSMPLMRLVVMGTNKDDLETSRHFWAKHLLTDMPCDLSPADVDETKAALRLHGQVHMCAMCAAEFTAEHVAVNCFVTLVKTTPAARIAGTQAHPKMREFMLNHPANMADLATLFDKSVWAKYAAKLPTLATWADDVKSKVMAPIMKDAADSLVLPGSRFQFAMVIHAHKGVITGLWSMDMVRAVCRQRRFSAKMANLVQSGSSAVYHFQTDALVQYPKFLTMAIAHPSKPLVPTSASDLAWHTHQLFPAAHRQQTLALTGSVMNHDDSDDARSEARIADGAKENGRPLDARV